MYLSSAAKKPNDGPPKSSRLPSDWPSPDADVGAERRRRLEDAERERVGRDHEQRAGALRGLRERTEVLDRAEEVRLLDEDGGRVVVDGGGERLDVGGPRSSSAVSTTSEPKPAACVASARASAGAPARDHELARRFSSLAM
jgi:hypothetical protein